MAGATTPGSTPPGVGASRGRRHAPELLALSAVAVAIATQLSLTRYADAIPHSWFGFVVATVMFGAATLIYARRNDAAETQAPACELSPNIEAVLLATVIGLAIFFRFWHLLSFPPGLWYDEALNARDAATLINGDHVRLWFNSTFGYSTLYLYLLAGSIRLFGYTVFALRIVPALAGLAAVVAFYPLARRLFGAVPALVATALLAASRWAVTFSRVSWEASLQPVLEILAVYFLIRALERKSRASFLIGGVALAAGLYSYVAFRMVPIVVLVLLAYIAATQRRLLRENLLGLAIWAVAFAAAVAPLANFAAHNPDRFLARTRAVNVFKEIDREGSYEPLRHNLRVSFEMFNVTGDANGRHNLPGAPMLDDITAALFVLGLATGIWSLRNWRRGVLAPWVVLALVPGALTLRLENPSAIRDIGAIPPLFLLVGLAIATIWRPLSSTRGGVRVFAALAMLCVLASAALNYNDLFRHQAHSQAVYDGFMPVYTDVGEMVAAEAGRKRTYVSGSFADTATVRFLAHGQSYGRYTPAYDLVFARGDRDVLLVLRENQSAIVETLRRLYPHLRHEDLTDPFGRRTYTRVTIPAADTRTIHDLAVTRAVTDGSPPTSSRAALDSEWTQGDLANGAVRATWDGYFWVAQPAGDIPLSLTVPGGDASIEIDGKPVQILPDAGSLKPIPGSEGGTAMLGPLSSGEHQIRLGARIAVPGRVRLRLGIGGESLAEADGATELLYGVSAGTGGFRVAYRSGDDFSADPVALARFPFAVPAPAIGEAHAIEYRGAFDVPSPGTYAFALDGSSPAQLFVDDDLLIDEGGAHPRKRVEASIDLATGPHTIAIQYVDQGGPDWSLWMQRPGEDWVRANGSEFRVPEGRSQAPAKVTIQPDRGPWTAMPLKFDGIDTLAGIATLPDGTVVAGGRDRLVAIGADGATIRSFSIDVQRISDLDVTASGQILVVDADASELLLISVDGEVIERFTGLFESAFGVGVDVARNIAYVASPAGGLLYRVPLTGGPVETLPISAPDAGSRPAQPSDIAVSAGGAFYITDFQKEKIIRSPDGVTGQPYRGVGGSGLLTPRVALFGSLVLVTDPVDARLIAYDMAGKQRGVYVFPEIGPGQGVYPIGLAPARGSNAVYVATEAGLVYRLSVDIPPATAAELAGLP